MLYINPVHPASCPDPFVLKFCGEYRCYSTGRASNRCVFETLGSILARVEATGPPAALAGKKMIDVLELSAAFRSRYGKEPRIFRAPGRVNLIGEHTDYNDGYVLPIAIDKETAVAIASRPDRILRVWSLNLETSAELNLDGLGTGHHGNWLDYIEGVPCALAAQGVPLTGSEIALKGDVSIGSGLSSSAALEVAFGTALVSISGGPIDKLSIALAGQTAEHVHVGINSGIMDQFTSANALADHAILLDCRSLESRFIPLNLDGYELVVCDSRVRHALASSEYNQRRQECEEGVRLLKTALPDIKALRDVSSAELNANQSLLPETVLRRCRHVVEENERALKAASALQSGNLAEMGMLMSESHRSLRDDYQVSCHELDVLVETAISRPGVLGARMTGGGFGGCTINLVVKPEVGSFIQRVAQEYEARTQVIAEIFVVHAQDGAGEINLS
jgi:galactokinase